MKEGVNFNYAGINSTDMGLLNVQVESTGLYEEQFLGDREIIEISVRGRDKPYFQQVKSSPLVLSLSFAFSDIYDEDKIRAVARWLKQDSYQPFYTDANPNRIFYCVLSSSSALLHNGLKQGYVNLEMRCDSPYTYSPVYITDIYDYSTNPSGVTLQLTNGGDVECKPEIWITKVGNGDVSIINNTNAGEEFKFIGLLDGETVYVDCEMEDITTDLDDTYRYSNFNDNYLELVIGVNNLFITGTCKLQFRYSFKTLQG